MDKETLNTKVVNHIKSLRIKEGLTQKALADLIDADKQIIQRIESGRVTPTTHTIYRITSVLNITLSEFFLFEDSDIK